MPPRSLHHLAIIFLACAIAPLTSAPDPQSPAEFAAALATTKGDAYLDLREALMSMTNPDQQAVLSLLESAAPSVRSHYIAQAIRARILQPDQAAFFDSRVKEACANPELLASGRWRYSLRGPWGRSYDPHLAELLLTADESTPPLDGPWDTLAENPQHLSLIQLVMQESLDSAQPDLRAASAFFELVREGHADAMTGPLLVQYYINRRNNYGTPASVIALPALIGALPEPDRTDALIEIREFEIQTMTAEGLAPWTEPDLATRVDQQGRSLGRTSSIELAQDLQELRAQRATAESIAQKRAAMEDAKAYEEEVGRRLVAVTLWNEIVSRISAEN